MQKRIQHKLRVKKALKKREGVRNFKPTVAQAQSWFSVLNRALFGNRLWMPDIYVKGIHNARGQIVYDWDGRVTPLGTYDSRKIPYHNHTLWIEMELASKFRTWKDFIETLAHEMVHLYQMQIQKDPYANHNKRFYAWKQKFATIGLSLER
tara:strand:+ start:6885 stop:7337 length:453 start_codon:yes stop_codon:yes gene_type:complete